jgi:hypothetical protein
VEWWAENWPSAVGAIAVGVAILIFRRWFAAELVASNRRMRWRPKPMRRENDVVLLLVVLIAIGFIGMPIAVLLDVPPFIVLTVLFVATAVGLW